MMDVALDSVGKDNDGLGWSRNLWVHGRDILHDIFGHNLLHERSPAGRQRVKLVLSRVTSGGRVVRRAAKVSSGAAPGGTKDIGFEVFWVRYGDGNSFLGEGGGKSM
uniref:Uncharacterized protein n=1 Tax=Tanacetum cinerariifolium TaxID=118510 RepID=A0A6L2NB84_TANCI|nr:hypothetical protein [Tanacetum cinerariifolium]